MNWAWFKDPLCYLCFHGFVVSALSLGGGEFETYFLQKYFTKSVDSTEFIWHKNSISVICCKKKPAMIHIIHIVELVIHSFPILMLDLAKLDGLDEFNCTQTEELTIHES